MGKVREIRRYIPASMKREGFQLLEKRENIWKLIRSLAVNTKQTSRCMITGYAEATSQIQPTYSNEILDDNYDDLMRSSHENRASKEHASDTSPHAPCTYQK